MDHHTKNKPVSLRQLADYLKLDPSTVSVVLNDVPGRSIAAATRERIRAAALKMNYRPSQLARSLRQRDTRTMGVLLPQVGEEYHATVLSGVADELERHSYLYLIAQHYHDPQRLRDYMDELMSRGAQGFIAIDTHLEGGPHIPLVSVAGHQRLNGITNILLDHAHAAELLIDHLYTCGHRSLAILKGQSESSDSEVRHSSLLAAAGRRGLALPASHVEQLQGAVHSPELGYHATERLLARTRDFSALLCFNDLAALGAIRALVDAGLQVPRDVSVLGFDDIRMSVFAQPSITTVRQPLHQMGVLAAQTLLQQVHSPASFTGQREIAATPTLIVRESSGAASVGCLPVLRAAGSKRARRSG